MKWRSLYWVNATDSDLLILVFQWLARRAAQLPVKLSLKWLVITSQTQYSDFMNSRDNVDTRMQLKMKIKLQDKIAICGNANMNNKHNTGRGS